MDNMADSISGIEYKGQPIQEVIIESAIKQDQILLQLTRMEQGMRDLEQRKADKTEFTSFETRLAASEKKVDKVEHEVISMRNGLVSDERLDKTIAEFKEQNLSLFAPLRDQVKENTKNHSELWTEFKKDKWRLYGGAGVIGFIWPVIWVLIQVYIIK
jgi:septation ring formation regulator EzrA